MSFSAAFVLPDRTDPDGRRAYRQPPVERSADDRDHVRTADTRHRHVEAVLARSEVDRLKIGDITGLALSDQVLDKLPEHVESFVGRLCPVSDDREPHHHGEGDHDVRRQERHRSVASELLHGGNRSHDYEVDEAQAQKGQGQQRDGVGTVVLASVEVHLATFRSRMSTFEGSDFRKQVNIYYIIVINIFQYGPLKIAPSQSSNI